MTLFGPIHLTLLATIAVVGVALAWACRTGLASGRVLRITLGVALAVNELLWWIFRYSHEGFHFPRNLPLQLCDVTVWMTVAECLTLKPWVVEFDYFAGMAGAGMALLTPDLWTPWPSYPAIYFFLAHGGIVVGIGVLVFGGIAPLGRGGSLEGIRRIVLLCRPCGRFQRGIPYQLYVSVYATEECFGAGCVWTVAGLSGAGGGPGAVAVFSAVATDAQSD